MESYFALALVAAQPMDVGRILPADNGRQLAFQFLEAALDISGFQGQAGLLLGLGDRVVFQKVGQGGQNLAKVVQAHIHLFPGQGQIGPTAVAALFRLNPQIPVFFAVLGVEKDFRSHPQVAPVIPQRRQQGFPVANQPFPLLPPGGIQSLGGQGQARLPGQAGQGFDFLIQPFRGNLKAELVGGGILQVMGFVDDDALIVRDNAAAAHQVGQQQGVIDHDDMGLLGPIPGTADETGAGAVEQVGAAAAFPGGHLAPVAGIPAQVQVAAIAIGGFSVLQPHRRFAQQPGLLRRQVVAVSQVIPAVQAQIVGPPLEQGILNRARLHYPGGRQHGA